MFSLAAFIARMAPNPNDVSKGAQLHALSTGTVVLASLINLGYKRRCPLNAEKDMLSKPETSASEAQKAYLCVSYGTLDDTNDLGPPENTGSLKQLIGRR